MDKRRVQNTRRTRRIGEKTKSTKTIRRERERIILKVKRCDVQYPSTNVCNTDSDPKVSMRRDRDLDEQAVREAIEARAKK